MNKIIGIEESVKKFVEYFNESLQNYERIEIEEVKKRFVKNKEIVICGMGGSGIAGLIIERIYNKAPIIALTTDEIPPKYKHSNFILVSYSGNTQEVLNVFDKHKSNVLCVITSGGKLKEKAQSNAIPIFNLPSNFIPRSTLPHVISLLSYIIKKLNVIGDKEINQLKESIKEISRIEKKLSQKAKEISKNIKANDILIFLSSYYFYPAAYRTKTQINESCKMHSYAEFFSEHNHNSIMAIKQKIDNVFYILYIDSNNNTIKKRMLFFINKLKEHGYRYSEITLPTSNPFTLMFGFILIGDYLSVEIAKKYKKNMEKGDIIKELKKFLRNK